MADKKTAPSDQLDETKVEEIIQKTSINKYDPFQLKSFIDEEIIAVRNF